MAIKCMHCDSDCPEGATYTSLGHRPRYSAPVRIVSQRGESPRQKEVWPDEAEGNCVAAMRGGEQPKAKDSSVTQVNSIQFVTLASLSPNGEAQMTPTTSKEE